MIKSCVTISLVPELVGGPWVYWDQPEISIVKARNAGFDGVELFSASADAVDSDMLFGLLDENEIRLAAVGTGAGKVLHGLHLVSPDVDIRRKARDFVSDMIEFGARFGAPAIIGSMQGRLEPGVERDQALVWLTEAFNELGGKAADFGVDLLLEPLNRYESDMVNTLSDGASLIQSLSCSSVFLLADLFHMNIEEESIPGSIRSAGSYIGHVHFVDSNRRAAGMGHINLAEAAEALKEVGFDGYASAEALACPDPDSAAAQTIRAFREWLM
jgi:sugar phosphate isomerase/epimerase